ncbi:helix-turn-helix transcriptional regulator [soil metagenome]
MAGDKPDIRERMRLGEAADILGVSPDTVRRWIKDGRLRSERTSGGQRTVARADVASLLALRRTAGRERPIVSRSARNRFPGIVTRIERDRLVGLVEVQAGPHRLVSLMTAEAVEEMGLSVGSEAICVVKATQVIVEVPEVRSARKDPATGAREPR